MTRLLILLMALALVSQPAAAQSGRMARGHLLVQRYCAGCHAVNRTGASPNAAAPPFRDLNARYRIDELGEALAEGILTGHPAMPQFTFSPSDVQAVLAYLKSIQSLQQASGRGLPIG